MLSISSRWLYYSAQCFLAADTLNFGSAGSGTNENIANGVVGNGSLVSGDMDNGKFGNGSLVSWDTGERVGSDSLVNRGRTRATGSEGSRSRVPGQVG